MSRRIAETDQQERHARARASSTNSRNAPRAEPPSAAAIARIPASTGPMQGVHPAANATPSGNAHAGPGSPSQERPALGVQGRASPAGTPSSSMSTPNATITTPATPDPDRRAQKTARTSRRTPRAAVNTAANPAMNSRIGTTAVARPLAGTDVAAGDERQVARARAGTRTGEANETTPGREREAPAPTTTTGRWSHQVGDHGGPWNAESRGRRGRRPARGLRSRGVPLR